MDSGRPRSVRIAVRLLYAALLPDLALSGLFVAEFLSVPNLLSSLLLAAFSVLLIYKTSRGRNWARSSYLAVYVLSSLNFPSALTNIVSESGGMFALGIVWLAANILELVALILLFTSASNDWFRKGEHPDLSRQEAAWSISPSRPGPPPASSSPPPRA